MIKKLNTAKYFIETCYLTIKFYIVLDIMIAKLNVICQLNS